MPSVSATPSQSVAPAAYGLHIRNEDSDTYLVELIEVPSQGDIIAHPWTIGPDSAGTAEVSSTLAGELQVRRVGCDAVASWEVVPGNYQLTIRNGAPSLEPSDDLPSAAPLSSASSCIVSGP